MIATIRPKPSSPPMTPPTMAPVLDFGMDVLASVYVGELELAGVDMVEVVTVESVLEVFPADVSSGRSAWRHL